MSSKFHHKILFQILLFCVTSEKPINASIEKNILGVLGLSIGILSLNDLFQSSARDPYLYSPTDFKTTYDYLDFLDSKIKDWGILSTSIPDTQINSFRKKLLENYKDHFSRQSLLSIIIHANLTTHPWALLSIEIEQHKTNLNRHKRNFICDLCAPKTSCEHYSIVIKRIEDILSELNQILGVLEYRTDFQSELSQARQEKKLKKTESLASAFLGFYLMFKALDMAAK